MNNPILSAETISAGYDGRKILSDVSLTLPEKKISVILGANGCGKSTLLKTFARLLKPESGMITLDGKSISSLPSREVAKTLGLLPQSPVVPEGIKVTDLVARGRFPYRRAFGGMRPEDFAAVEEALELMGITELADRSVDELSGGQRQRVWIALALAQQTDILLLDEPTTYLDAAHQLQMMQEARALAAAGKNIVMVLHDLPLALRHADHAALLCSGQVAAEGSAEELFSSGILNTVFGVRLGRTQTLTGWHYYLDSL